MLPTFSRTNDRCVKTAMDFHQSHDLSNSIKVDQSACVPRKQANSTFRTIADYATPVLSLKPRRSSQLTNLPVKEFVKLNHKIGKPEHGLEYYYLTDNSQKLASTPLHSKIFNGEKRTFLDEAI